jgi:hypothetical protein
MIVEYEFPGDWDGILGVTDIPDSEHGLIHALHMGVLAGATGAIYYPPNEKERYFRISPYLGIMLEI